MRGQADREALIARETGREMPSDSICRVLFRLTGINA